jgi:F-type H+-transporting ATPase subunit b
MPQFDFTHVFWPQVVWLAVFFAVLYFGVVRLTLPKLGRTMAAREDKMTGDITIAETAKAEADRIAADYDAGVAAAQDAARGKLAAARLKATASIEKKLATTNEALAALGAEAQASLDAARARALVEIEAVAGDTAADIVEKLTGRRPDVNVANAAARAALA